MAGSEEQTLVLYSRLAFYPVHWLALEELVRRYLVRGVVLAGRPQELPSVHEAHGRARRATAGLPIEVRQMPAGSRAARLAWVAREVHAARPSAIWVQEEPFDPFLLEILGLYRLRPGVRIVCAVCESIFPPPRRRLERVGRRALWPRLDGLLTVAPPSEEGIRAAGMPASVPAFPLVVGGLEPAGEPAPMQLPFDRQDGDFVVGFAGRIVEEKGWKVLVEAVAALPESVKLVFAGAGLQLDELRARASRPGLSGRMYYVGLLPKGELWGFYRAIDSLAVPSLTTPWWKEQSASTLIDGLCMGLPIVGSDSGGIPGVMGAAGLLAPESDPVALAGALTRLRDDADLRTKLGAAGKERFRREFAIPVYADKIAAALQLEPRANAG